MASYFILLLWFTFTSSVLCDSPEHNSTIVEFEHEYCKSELHHELSNRFYHKTASLVDSGDELDIFARFRGTNDAYFILTESTSETGPLYWVILGSHSNTFSEIRRSKDRKNMQVKISTPNIIPASSEWRGFLVKYNQRNGRLAVYLEGSGVELMSWKDPQPLTIKYYSFATYIGAQLQVAHSCHAKDEYSVVEITHADSLMELHNISMDLDEGDVFVPGTSASRTVHGFDSQYFAIIVLCPVLNSIIQ